MPAFPPRGPLGVEFPRFSGTTQALRLPPARPSALAWSRWRYHHLLWGLVTRLPVAGGGGGGGASQVSGEPSCAHALLLDPGGISAPGPRGVSMLPSAKSHGVGSRDHLCLSGLNYTAYSLPVYASRPGSPQSAQHSVPAAGHALPGGIDYPLGPFEGFLRHASSLPRLCLAHHFGRAPPPPCTGRPTANVCAPPLRARQAAAAL